MRSLAATFDWPHGEKAIAQARFNRGLAGSWFSVDVGDGPAVILEDDAEVSRVWFSWWTKAWMAYGTRVDLAGISLMRQTFVAKKPSKQREIVNRHEPFLYRLVGTIGFAPKASVWRAFRAWLQEINFDGFEPVIPGVATTDMWRRAGSRKMWSQHFNFFCE